MLSVIYPKYLKNNFDIRQKTCHYCNNNLKIENILTTDKSINSKKLNNYIKIIKCSNCCKCIICDNIIEYDILNNLNINDDHLCLKCSIKKIIIV